MKIVIVNYRFFISGGPERYLFNIIEHLERLGHTIIPFSIINNNNNESKYSSYFLTKIYKGADVYFKDYSKRNFKILFKVFFRFFYSFEAKKKLSKLILDTKPDIIYILQFQNKISCSIFDAAKKYNIPIVQRISDFGLICANSHFYLLKSGSVCELCLHSSKINAIINKCVFNSYLYSTLKVLSLKLQEILSIVDKIDCFVVPSLFTINKLIEYKIKPDKLHHIPTFFNTTNILNNTSCIKYNDFALYVGRIEPEKGLMTLIQAFENTTYSLKIIGTSQSGFDVYLKNYLIGKTHNIEFIGWKSFNEIQFFLSTCLFTIVPSEWYDNMPNVYSGHTDPTIPEILPPPWRGDFLRTKCKERSMAIYACKIILF